MGRLEELLDKCPPDYQHTWGWHYLKRQCHPNALTFAGHDGGVNSMAFNPDGERIATGCQIAKTPRKTQGAKSA